jgi:hypothetical protein
MDLFKDTLFEVVPYEGSLEILHGLVVPAGSVVMTGLEVPWRPWRSSESAQALLKQLLGIKRKKAAPEPEEEPPAAGAGSDSDDSEESEDESQEAASDEDEDAGSEDD